MPASGLATIAAIASVRARSGSICGRPTLGCPSANAVESARLMPPSSGARIGIYEVVAKVGEGGMGEVYQARDTKLHRLVALKTLPAGFAADADRLARFRREAQVLASLNHPNIAAIYGLEDSGATPALVMEFVPGLTRSDVATSPMAL